MPGLLAVQQIPIGTQQQLRQVGIGPGLADPTAEGRWCVDAGLCSGPGGEAGRQRIEEPVGVLE